ncbi:hypothetical protein TYRP_003427 [Tyrophagus putrescentiae]|nr:hypothetical protein TYRP_003427 [Tyrophagus putrescentiae]
MAAVAVKKSPPAILSQHYYLSADLCKVLKIIAFHQEELYLAQSHSTSSSYIAATNASSSAAASTSTAAAKSSDSTVDISKSLATS